MDTKKSALLLALLALFAGQSAAQGQAPNRLDVVRRVSAEDPARFACAHTGRSCESDWIKAVAAALHQEDARWGLNMKRDDDRQGISLDVVVFRLGPTDRHVQAFDVCGACGGTNPQAVWNDITDWASLGRPGTARWVKPPTASPSPPPVPAPTPAPAPPAAPGVDLSVVLAKLDTALAELATLKAQHDGVAAVAVEARDVAYAARDHAHAIREGLLPEIAKAIASPPCMVGRVPKAFGGAADVRFCPELPR
jgi:hypothetical protein